MPVAVGFGIGTPEQAAEVGRIADGVIIGSRLVRAAGEAGSPQAAADAVAELPPRDARRPRLLGADPAADHKLPAAWEWSSHSSWRSPR